MLHIYLIRDRISTSSEKLIKYRRTEEYDIAGTSTQTINHIVLDVVKRIITADFDIHSPCIGQYVLFSFVQGI